MPQGAAKGDPSSELEVPEGGQGGIEERRRLMEEDLELRAAEERLVFMERIERFDGIEQDLAKTESGAR